MGWGRGVRPAGGGRGGRPGWRGAGGRGVGAAQDGKGAELAARPAPTARCHFLQLELSSRLQEWGEGRVCDVAMAAVRCLATKYWGSEADERWGGGTAVGTSAKELKTLGKHFRGVPDRSLDVVRCRGERSIQGHREGRGHLRRRPPGGIYVSAVQARTRTWGLCSCWLEPDVTVSIVSFPRASLNPVQSLLLECWK